MNCRIVRYSQPRPTARLAVAEIGSLSLAEATARTQSVHPMTRMLAMALHWLSRRGEIVVEAVDGLVAPDGAGAGGGGCPSPSSFSGCSRSAILWLDKDLTKPLPAA